MQLKTYFAQDASGNIIPNAQVFVYLAGTTTLASGLVDQDGAPLTNPFNADSSAAVVFAAPDGEYDVKCSGASRTVTIRAQLFDGGAFKSDLAAPGGSDLVGYDSGTAQDVLDEAKPIANYTSLRAYTGRATGVRITQSGLAGFFQRDDADTTSADNGGTIIVDGAGRRWKRLYSGAVNLLWFGADKLGAVDSSDAILRAAALGQVVYAPSGTYLSSIQNLPSNTYICGDGETTIFKPLTNTARCALGCQSSSASTFIRNIFLRDFKILGSVGADGFYEQAHLASFNGVDGLWIERVNFVGQRGDSIYLGSGDTGGLERHNKNVRIVKCTFDGVNNDNRQAISVIDVDGLWIEQNEFKNCTRTNQPSVIDMEPNANPWHVIKNVWVRKNKFDNCGGNVGTVAVYIPVDTIAVPTNINVEANVANSALQVSGAAFFAFRAPYTVTTTSVDSKVSVLGNRAYGGAGQGRGLHLHGVRGVASRGNTWEDFAPAGILCGQTNQCADIVVQDVFRRCGSQAGTPRGAEIYAVVNLDMTGSVFDDCGDGSASAAAINFKTGTSSGVKLNGIRIESPTSKTTRAVLKDAGHTFTPSTNQFYENNWGTLSNQFVAHESDSIWTTFTPVAEGTTSAGVGTYTRQYGRWRRIGRQVFFEMEVVQSSHTGTGQLELSLPVSPHASGNNELKTVPVMLDGVATTGGQIGGINPGASAGGVTGCIRCYHTGTGVLQQTVIPTGAATFRAAGTYMAA